MIGFGLGLVVGIAVAEPGQTGLTASSEPEVEIPTINGIPTVLVEAARDSAQKPLWERMKNISQPLKGSPYVVDAIGEGRGPDPDPVVRYDVFDCLTFVEEVLALGLPHDPLESPQIRQILRYGPEGGMTYENRNHFMLHQWIPNNISNGMLKDITSELGTPVTMKKTVSVSTWRNWKSRPKFELTDEQFPTGEYRLEVLPLDQALEAVPHIPPGALILTIRQNRSYVPIVVTHIGFVVPSDDPERPLLRHATKMGAVPRVRDDFMDWYVEHLANYRYWKVAGLVVLMPQEIEPR